MKKQFVSLLTAISVIGFVQQAMADTPLEWSDVGYTQGRYSRIYFDYIQGGGGAYGTFYVINDWMVNRDDGGVNGGLKAGEYNEFAFTLGTNNYDIKIYQDGTSSISGGTLLNFTSSTGWRTSPNDPSVAHTIWEFSFDVEPVVITTFSSCDPVGNVTSYVAPSAPSVITGMPSIYPHIVDAAFSDVPAPYIAPPDPLRSYQFPTYDPDITIPTITLKDGGGTIVPEPSSVLLLGIGVLGAGYIKRRKSFSEV
jgi:hypothetical protein